MMIVGVGVSTRASPQFKIKLMYQPVFFMQRNMVYAWDMKGIKPTFAPKVKELNGLELPKGTVLEVEFVQELQGEVRMTSFVNCMTTITTALSTGGGTPS